MRKIACLISAVFAFAIVEASEGVERNGMKLDDFLADHSTEENVVDIRAEPKTVYIEDGRNAQYFNFDFALAGLTDKELTLRFLKVGVYNSKDQLLTFRYLNHNAVETPGIQTIGKTTIRGKEAFDIYNPFFEFPKEMKISYLRYMFTFVEKKTSKEFYYGNIVVKPVLYKQTVKLTLPMKGLMTIIDGHDFYSHHRRFGMTAARTATNNQFQSNFSRFSLDFSLIGADGNLRKMDPTETHSNYDFHFSDIRKFYTHGAKVISPADGEVVEVVNDLEDLYEQQFDFDKAVKEGRVQDIAGNRVIIKHNEREFSHLFHFEKGSIQVKVGQKVKRGQELGRIGFSGTASVYSHLHYQLMNGKEFLKNEALPFQFSDVTLMLGAKKTKYQKTTVDTGDLILN